MEEKTCSKCGETRQVGEFSRNPRYRLGVYCWCKSCCSKTQSNWIRLHPEVNKKNCHLGYQRHKQQRNVANKIWQQEHADAWKEYHTQWDASNRYLYAEKLRMSTNLRYQQLRSEILAAYGGKCTCCGENRPEFLCIDHVEGGGSAHRRVVKSGQQFLRAVKREGFPSTYRLLCANCNMAYGVRGSCPHEVTVCV